MLLPAGTGVEVRNGFDGAWSSGFEVAGHEQDRYRILRCSDRSLLPRPFTTEEVRRTRNRASMWWV